MKENVYDSSTSRITDIMNSESHFDKFYFLRLSEQIHEADVNFTESSIEISNQFKLAMYEYTKDVIDLEADDLRFITSLLTHPKKHVRVLAAGFLLVRGYIQGWPVILAEARLVRMPGEGATTDQWRDYSAGRGARQFLTFNYGRIKHLDLAPTLEEAEARWRAEGVTERNIMLLDIPRLRPAPRRS